MCTQMERLVLDLPLKEKGFSYSDALEKEYHWKAKLSRAGKLKRNN